MVGLDEDGLLCASPPRKRRPDPSLPSPTPLGASIPGSQSLPHDPSSHIPPSLPSNSFIEPIPIVPPDVPAWKSSLVLVDNPAAIDNPMAVEAAAEEMKRFNATWNATSLDPDGTITEFRAAMANVFNAYRALADNDLAPVLHDAADNAIALAPDFSDLDPGAFGRLRSLIQSN